MINCILNRCQDSFMVGGFKITSHKIKIKSNSLEKLLKDLVLLEKIGVGRWDITAPNEHLISDPKGVLQLMLKLLGNKHVLSEASGTYNFLGSLEIIHQFNHEINGLSIYTTNEGKGISIWAETVKNGKDSKDTEFTIVLNK